MVKQTILILGCGVGGIVAANILNEKLGEQAEVKVVERKKVFQFPPSYPWVMLGKRKPDQIQRDLQAIKKKGIDVVQGEVSSIEPKKQSVKVDSSTLHYDYLIIALGAQYAPEKISGLKETAHHIYDLESALRFQKAIEEFKGGTIAVGISSLPYKCPAAPYETALLLDDYFRKKGLGDRVKIRFFTPEGMPLPAAGPEIGGKAAEFIRSKRIDVKFGVKLKEVIPGEARFEDESVISFDMLFAVPPHRCPPPVEEAGLTDKTGWIPVDPNTMKTSYENVYAVGDVAAVPTPSGFVPYLPKAGVFAHGQAETVANNIAFEIKRKGKQKIWDGSGACFLMVGGGQSAFIKGNWYTKPHPTVQFYSPSRIWYMQRALFEKYWMHHWF